MAPNPQELSAQQEQHEGAALHDHEPVVVISGMSALLPSCDNITHFSEKLYDKVNMVKCDPPRWQFKHPELPEYSGKISGLNLFDAQFFKVHFKLAQVMEIMTRKLLEQSYQALLDAGVNPNELSGKQVGVFIASGFSESDKKCCYSNISLGILGCAKTMLANRISYYLNVKGPSLTFDAMCCGSLVALEQAYAAILRGECDSAIVGGARLLLHPPTYIQYTRIVPVNIDGNTKCYDANADGFTPSEAINAIYIQKSCDARRIYAALRHIKSRYFPSGEKKIEHKLSYYRQNAALTEFMREFYREAGVPTSEVEYIEGIGAANFEADETELQSFSDTFCNLRQQPLMVGSVSSNIGHTENASGICGIIKTALAYQKGILAANLNCDYPREDIEALQKGTMKIVTDHSPFRRTFAAINSAAISGLNAHALLQGVYRPKNLFQYKCKIPYIVTLSGRQESSVHRILDDLKSHPLDPEEIALLRSFHKSPITGHLARGFGIFAADENGNNAGVLAEHVDYFDTAKKPLWFVYSGMGSQWNTMGAQLMRIPVFAAAIERCDKVLKQRGLDIVNIITSSDPEIYKNILNSFVGICAIQIGLTDLLKVVGLEPDNIIGHSVGELVCAYADGCTSTEETILCAYSRGLVSVQTPFIRGSMAAVGIGYKHVSRLCPPEIEVACHNGPESSTISGPADKMREFVAQLTAQGIFAREVPCSNIAYHSKYIADAGPGLLNCLKEVIKTPKRRSERWLSTSIPQDRWGEPIAQYASAEYHTNNLLNPVLFEETSRLIPNDAVLVEVAPHGLLQAILKRSLPSSCQNIPLTRRGHADNAMLVLEALGKLYMSGYDVDTAALYPKVHFPVSTETRHLSHLVEWAHNEKWDVAIYQSAERKHASIYKPIISIYDDDYQDLMGHVIEGSCVFPYSGALVCVWDALAMTFNRSKREMSVEFQDVKLVGQPRVLAQHPLRLTVSVHRGNGRFEVLHGKNMIMSGFVFVKENQRLYINEEDLTVDLHCSDIYKILNERGYEYKKGFRSIRGCNMKLTRAEITWQNNWMTFIDGVLQFHALQRSHPAVSQPRLIGRLTIDTRGHYTLCEDNSVHFLHASCDLVSVRCGGLKIENIVYYDKLGIAAQLPDLKMRKTIEWFDECGTVDVLTTLYMYLQIVSDVVGKKEISAVNINDECQHNHELLEVGQMLQASLGIKVNVIEISNTDIIQHTEELRKADVILTHHILNKKKQGAELHYIVKPDTFVIAAGFDTTSVLPQELYRAVCGRGKGSSRIELACWSPTAPNVSAVCAGKSSGEYFVPFEQKTKATGDVKLNCSRPGDQTSLQWQEFHKTEHSDHWISVKYVGLNVTDAKRATSEILPQSVVETGFGMDFSGYSRSGVRVMGVVAGGAASSAVRARPELLWPVPPHWTLQDAATVPLPYLQALYCMAIKTQLHKNMNVLVHGGAGALGQAAIAIALAHDARVFTTVSDVRKKHFLQRLFPTLPAGNIGNSRDNSFEDMVMFATQGEGCHIIISCVNGNLKTSTLNCCATSGSAFDTSQIPGREPFTYGMYHMTQSRSYIPVDFSSVFTENKIEEMNSLRLMLSEGIARGWVRPLSRVTYAPLAAPRALRLLAASNHRGRVLLDMQTQSFTIEPRLECSADLWSVVVSDDDNCGVQLADVLVSRGAKRLHLHSPRPTSLIDFKARSWRNIGVDVELSYKNENIISKLQHHGDAVEGIFIASLRDHDNHLVDLLNVESKNLSPSLKYFAVISDDEAFGQKQMLQRRTENLPSTVIQLRNLQQFSEVEQTDLEHSEVNATGAPLKLSTAFQTVVDTVKADGIVFVAHAKPPTPRSLLEKIADIPGVTLPDQPDGSMTLHQIGVDEEAASRICTILRDNYNLQLPKDVILNLTIARLKSLQGIKVGAGNDSGLDTFINHVDSDELLASADVVEVPTLIHRSEMRFDEFDSDATYLCVVPGVEGHHARFRALCERLKLPAVVLQPGLDHLHDTPQTIARRFVNTMMKRLNVKNHFYIMGYEFGVMIALEMAGILESHGLTGTVYCLGGGPEDIRAVFEKQIEGSEDRVQDSVAKHLYALMGGSLTSEVSRALSRASSWDDKVDLCARLLRDKVTYTDQYVRLVFKSVYSKVHALRNYSSTLPALNSELVVLRSDQFKSDDFSSASTLSRTPPRLHVINTPFATICDDMRCAPIINSYLSPEILDSFDKRNVCETYLLNNEVFMQAVSAD